jgi:hypothetical protein
MPHDLEGPSTPLWSGRHRLHINWRWFKYANGAKEEAEESTVPSNKQMTQSSDE